MSGLIADAPHRVDQTAVEPRIDFLPYVTDVDIDNVCPGVERYVPNVLDDFRPRHRLTCIAKQVFEKSLANARELTELVTKANAEAFDVITKRVSESLDELREQAKNRAHR